MDTAVMTLIEQGFTDLKGVVTDVMAIAVPAVVGIICLVQGASFALRKVRGLLSWA